MQAGEELCSQCASILFTIKEPTMNKPKPVPPPPKKKKMPSDKDYLAALGPCGK
jgi:hypothetical protein